MTTLAFDRSERHKDQDGNLHVRRTNISKATVNPYRGSEIPGYEALGLEPDRIYQMFRPPEELAKAADTFNNLRLLSKHVAVSADDPKEGLVAGTTGTDARFEHPYLVNSLTIWRAADIADVESREKCELSCAYYYEPDMTPGIYEGLRYDGRMCNLRGNHVALVEAGRAGPDVQVHDSLENVRMSAPLASRKALIVKGALAAYLAPKLKTALAFDSALSTVTRANWMTEKPKLTAEIIRLATPKLAADASLDDLHAFIDRMDKEDDGAAEDDEIDAEDEEDDEDEDEEKKKADAKDKKAKDMKAKDKKARDAKAKDADCEAEDEEDDKKAKDGKAMDAAIAAAEARVVTRMNDIAAAREVVRPIIGSVSLAMDSAAAIYKLALDAAKVDLTGVDPSAYRAMVSMLPKAGAKPAKIAMDSGASSLNTMFPALSRINQS